MTGPASILVVDDDGQSLALVVRILSSDGYRVRAADSGELALASLEKEIPDLIILDVHLQGIDGFEFCRRLQSQTETKDTPVILISAFVEPRDWIRGLDVGASDFLAKPFSNAEILVRVKNHLRFVDTLADLTEKEFQYHNLADSGLALIWRAGTDKKCHFFNLPWLRFTGRTLEQELGDGWTEGVHPEDLDRCFQTYVGAFDQHQPFEMEYRLRHHSGEYRWILDMGTPNHDREGKFLGYIGHCFDITEKMKYQESLQRNDRLDSLGLLAGGIAHDFNNLLAGLFANLSMARNEAAGIPSASRHLDKAMGAFERAKDLTRQLLTFAKGGDPIRKPGDLGELVRESVTFALSGSSVASEFDIEAGLPPCDFDANQIGQVVDNLIINAKQAMPAGGRITITVRSERLGRGQSPGLAEGFYQTVSISDTGMGIPTSVLSRIYDPFFTTKPKGNGLGLATCYSILQKHQGAIEVESVVGQGTTFRFRLPAASESTRLPATTVPGAHRGLGLFLLLDDEDLLLDLGTEWLTEFGYTVVTGKEGATLLGHIPKWAEEGEVPVAALLDLTVPGGRGGMDIVSELRAAYPDLILFATSGYSEDPVMAKPQEFGFTASLSKPFLKNDLASLLNQFLPKK